MENYLIGPFSAVPFVTPFVTPALIGVSLIFKTGGIRAGVKGAGVKKGPIRYHARTQFFHPIPIFML